MTDEVKNMTPQQRADFVAQFMGEHANQFVDLGMSKDDILAGAFNFFAISMTESYGREKTADWLEDMANRVRQSAELDFEPPTIN